MKRYLIQLKFNQLHLLQLHSMYLLLLHLYQIRMIQKRKTLYFLLRLFFKQGKKNLHFIWHKKIPHNTIKPKYLLLNTTFQPLILYVFYISSRYYHNLIECSKDSRIFVEFSRIIQNVYWKFLNLSECSRRFFNVCRMFMEGSRRF